METEHFQVAQDFECYIPGFMIISPKRHVVSVRDFTSGERAEFYKIKYAVEDAIMSILGVGSVHHIEEKS
ncbi:MAG: hypothetical protein LBF15_01510 [Candidatus Peribacteria bacterium]|nr:hypothetical protein [Candidatus Peribacteria bacterium]